MFIITLPLVGEWSIVMSMSVCLFVCLSVCENIFRTTCLATTKFIVKVTVAVARSSDSKMIHYVQQQSPFMATIQVSFLPLVL